MTEKHIESLIGKFISRAINKEELDILTAWVEKKGNLKVFEDYVKLNYALDYNLMSFDSEKAFLEFENNTKEVSGKEDVRRVVFMKNIWRVAAAIAVVFAMTAIWSLHKDSVKESVSMVGQATAVSPGTDRAVLTLENGDYVALEKGNLFTTANRKSDGEKLVYDQAAKEGSSLQYNYLTIPKGGQFFVQLSDGTQVWLNADSKLKYPVNFQKGQAREVELVYGEAYFKVSSSAKHNGDVFRVRNQMQQIEVLGTEFNIKSYADDTAYFTTLVEGSIAIGNDIVNKILRPGEQSVINRKSEEIHIKKVDLDYEVAWKKGLFVFQEEPLVVMMQTLSRWYDVVVVFEDTAKQKEKFSGVLPRTEKIENLLMALEKTGEVQFNIKNNTIMVK